MNGIEEIKKIKDKYCIKHHHELNSVCSYCALVDQLVQLFQAPEEVLLSDEEISQHIQEDCKLWCPTKGEFLQEVGEVIAKAQANKAKLSYKKHNQERIRELFEELEKKKVAIWRSIKSGAGDCAMPKQYIVFMFKVDDFQSLKTKYLKEGG